jgi:hypothetical protein
MVKTGEVNARKQAVIAKRQRYDNNPKYKSYRVGKENLVFLSVWGLEYFPTCAIM